MKLKIIISREARFKAVSERTRTQYIWAQCQCLWAHWSKTQLLRVCFRSSDFARGELNGSDQVLVESWMEWLTVTKM